jgi:hypothetical protein
MLGLIAGLTKQSVRMRLGSVIGGGVLKDGDWIKMTDVDWDAVNETDWDAWQLTSDT